MLGSHQNRKQAKTNPHQNITTAWLRGLGEHSCETTLIPVQLPEHLFTNAMLTTGNPNAVRPAVLRIDIEIGLGH